MYFELSLNNQVYVPRVAIAATRQVTYRLLQSMAQLFQSGPILEPDLALQPFKMSFGMVGILSRRSRQEISQVDLA